MDEIELLQHVSEQLDTCISIGQAILAIIILVIIGLMFKYLYKFWDMFF